MRSLLGEVPWPVLCRRSNRMSMMASLSLEFYKYMKMQSLVCLSHWSYTLKIFLLPVTCSTFFFFPPWLYFLELHCTKWSLTAMQTPMFPWKPLSTAEYTRAIFEPFVHLINYVFVLKAAWLDCLIMY